MFQPGRSYKVKVEKSPGEFGFGRATIVKKEGNKLFFQLKSARDPNEYLPRGTRLWFVGDDPGGAFNGLWFATVDGKRMIGRKRVMECGSPKFQAITQKRRSQRYRVDLPVVIFNAEGEELDWFPRACDISSSGMGLRTKQQKLTDISAGDQVKISIRGKTNSIEAKCKVIRVAYDWITNQSSVGLEFTELSAKDADLRDRLIEHLASGQGDDSSERGVIPKSTLSGWLTRTQDNLKIVKPSKGSADNQEDGLQDNDAHDGDNGGKEL